MSGTTTSTTGTPVTFINVPAIMEAGGLILLTAAIITGVIKWLKGLLGEERARTERDITALSQRVANSASRLDGLEHQDGAKEVRIAKLEVSMENFREGQTRIETAVTKVGDKLDNLVQSMRPGA